MKKLSLIGILLLLTFNFGTAQEYYFPEQNEVWKQEAAKKFKIAQSKLDEAVQFAKDNEYSGSRDLRIAISKGFEREPFHKILGPTKKRGGPAGMILKNGYLITSWGDTKRVDMTFSVTKSFLSTVAGLASDENLIADTNDKVGTISGTALLMVNTIQK